MLRAGIENALLEKLDQFAQTLRDARFLPDPVKVGVGLQNVKVIVHGLLLVHVLVAQPGFGTGFRPIAAAYFNITAEFGIVRVPFDQFKQLLGAGQRGQYAKSPVVFRERVDVKRLAVNFLGIVQNDPPGIIQPPERAAMLRVPEPVHHVIKRAVGHLPEEFVRPRLMNRRKGPKDAAVDNQPLGLGPVGLEVIGQPAHPAALLVVHGRSAPERHEMIEQMIANALRKVFQFGRIH